MAAEQTGIFKTRPKRPYYLYKAGWTSDQKSPLEHPYFSDPDAIEGEEESNIIPLVAKENPEDYTIKELRAMAKDNGYKLKFGQERVELEILAGVREPPPDDGISPLKERSDANSR